MTVRFATLFAFVAAMLFGLATAATPSEAAEKAVTIKPSSGIVGTVVEAKLTGAPPNDPITVIFKIPGDPILTTGTTDANGEATFTFTIPYALSGTYPIFFTDFKCSCQIATDFTVIVGQRTPTPTATPTTPPTATPPATSTPTQPATATPTVTPQVPIAGTTTPFTPGGPNVGVLGLGFLLVLTVLAWFAATRRGDFGEPVAAGWPLDDGPDYSTDPDFSEMRFAAEESRPFRPIEEPGRVTRVVEAATGTIDAIGLLFRKK